MASLAEITRPATNIDRRQCKRSVPLEVLVLGQSRTGTTSIRAALYGLGYNDVYHYSSVIRENPRDSEMWLEAYKAKFEGVGKPYGREEFDKLLGHCQAVTDHPCASFGPELIAAYPNAKVVLSVRDNVDTWYKSVETTIWPFVKLRFAPQQSWQVKLACALGLLPPLPGNFQGMTDMSCKHTCFGTFPETGKQWYESENEKIRRLVPKDRLLEFNVKEGYEPLCKFLGKPNPGGPFPRMNDSKFFAERSKAVRKMHMQNMATKVGKFLGVVLLIILAWVYMSKGGKMPKILIPVHSS